MFFSYYSFHIVFTRGQELTYTLVEPTIKQAYDFIKQYHSSKAEKTLLVLIGDCMVDYHGRARSFLDWGERIFMLKQDGNVLIHQPTMREPINWQPAGSITEFKVNKKQQLLALSRHTKPPEKMKVIFRRIDTVLIRNLYDQASLIISGMEVDVVNQIMQDPAVIEEGLRIAKREKQVPSGMIDLFCYDKEHTPVIIEVKRSLATISAVHQLRMYVHDLKGESEQASVRGILCAPKIPDMVKNLLTDYDLEWKEIERKVVLPDDNQCTLKEF